MKLYWFDTFLGLSLTWLCRTALRNTPLVSETLYESLASTPQRTHFAVAAAVCVARVALGKSWTKRVIGTTGNAVLVTGTSTGIGRAAVARLLREGFVVFATVRRKRDSESLVTEFGDNCIPVLVDVSSSQEITESVARVRQTLEQRKLRLVGLVNNAGIAGTGPLELKTRDDIDCVLNINVAGVLDVTRQYLPLLREGAKGSRAGARVVNISSLAGLVYFKNASVYCASKWAVVGITNCLDLELSQFNIRVSCIEPGLVRTEFTNNAFDAYGDAVTGKHASDEVKSTYASYIEKYRSRIENARQNPDEHTMGNGISAEVVAERVVEQLTENSPDRHVLVGKEAGLVNFILKLPTFLADKIYSSI